MVPCLVSEILVSIAFPIIPDEAMLFAMAKACLILQKYSVSCHFQGVDLEILNIKYSEKFTST